jgi:serine protease Do
MLRAWISVVVALILAGVCPCAVADQEPGSGDSRPKRRTPVVEVFENWKDSVVFVSGPTAKTGSPSTEEFFTPSASTGQERNLGSGFILHESGYIVTNAHGVERHIENMVTLWNGTTFPAELIACLHNQDLALLKINTPRRLKAVRLGRAGDVMIGETVIVIANPLGLMQTCTAGVVSAVGRTTRLADLPGVTLQDAIQSDAAINPGSSGGPWFNVVGDVIGVTSSMKKDAENVAFAISAASLRKAIPEMLDIERRDGFFTGLEVGVNGPCRVTAVQPDSPASRANIGSKDVLVRLADIPTSTATDYYLALVGRKPGEPLAVDLVRNGKTYHGVLTPVPRPKPDGAGLLKQKLGLTVVPLDAAKAKAMGLRTSRGFVVTSVDRAIYEKLQDKPEPGDVLARIDAIRPRDLDQVGFLLEKLRRGEPLQLVLLRRKDNLAIRLDMNIFLR